jgi:hypothetical protein
MRIPLLLIPVVAACGQVKSRSEPPPDVGPVDVALADAPSDSQGLCHVEVPALPMWNVLGPFGTTDDPAGSGVTVWKAGDHVPAVAAFNVPFQVGDQITELSFRAYGNGTGEGLKQLEVVYQSGDPPTYQILAGPTDDLGRKAQWGRVGFANFHVATLEAGSLWVQFYLTEAGYYIGQVTPILERPCTTH